MKRVLALAGASLLAGVAAYLIWVHEPDYGREPGVSATTAWLISLGEANGLPLTPSNVGRVEFVTINSYASETEAVHLSKLGLTINAVKGRHPVENISLLRHLPRVRWLTIHYAEVARDDAAALTFSGLARTENLLWYGADNLTDAGMAHIGRMTALRWLVVKRDRSGAPSHPISGIKHLGSLQELTELSLSGFEVDDSLASVARLPKLRSLNLGSNAIRASGLRHLGTMTMLTDLSLSSATLDGSLAPVGRLPNLRSLNVSQINADDAQIGSLSGAATIEKLNADGATIGDKAVAALGVMPKLKTLSLEGTKIQADLARLGASLSLQSMTLNSAELDDANAAGLGQIKSLTDINLFDTAAGDKTAAALSKLSGLIGVGFANTKITDAGVGYLAAAPILKALALNNTKIGDEALAHLAQAPALVSLSLDGTRVTDAGLRHLAAMKTLESLYVRDTGVTQAGVDSLLALRPSLSVRK